jgi:hypothetical protein
MPQLLSDARSHGHTSWQRRICCPCPEYLFAAIVTAHSVFRRRRNNATHDDDSVDARQKSPTYGIPSEAPQDEKREHDENRCFPPVVIPPHQALA